jgi:repressor of nif and glnA expression
MPREYPVSEENSEMPNLSYFTTLNELELLLFHTNNIYTNILRILKESFYGLKHKQIWKRLEKYYQKKLLPKRLYGPLKKLEEMKLVSYDHESKRYTLTNEGKILAKKLFEC